MLERYAPRARRARRRRSLWLLGGACVVALTGGALSTWAVLALRRAPPRSGPVEMAPASGERAPPQTEAAAGNAGKASTARGRAARAERAWPPLDLVAGGQDLGWWSQQLTEARAAPEAHARYALLTTRAAANGLAVEVGPTGVRVTPTARLLDEVANSAGPSGADIGGAPRTATVAAAPTDAELGALVEALEVDLAARRTYRRTPKHPRVVLAPSANARAALRIQFAAGAFHDRHRTGLTRVAEHALVAASEHEPYERLAADLDAVGATLDLETGVTESAVTLEAPRHVFPALAARLLRMCLAPRLAAPKLDDAKSRAIAASGDGDVEVLASILASAALSAPGYTNDPKGELGAIQEIDEAHVRRHYAGALSPANATVVVTGGFDPKVIEGLLAGVQGGERVAFERPREDLPGTYHAAAGMHVHLVAYPVSLRSPEEVAATRLAAAVMEERLFHHFRELGAAYQVVVAPLHRRWLDFLFVVIPFGSDPSPKVSTLIEMEVERIGTSGPTDEELRRNRAHVLEALRALEDHPKRLAAHLAEESDVEGPGPDVLRAIATLPRARFLELARPWLAPSRAIHVELGPPTRTLLLEERRGGRR